MNKQHSSSVPDYAMCISVLARGVPKHWIWKLVSINKEEITSCTLPDVLHHFRNKLNNNLLCTLRMVHHVPSSDRTVPSSWSSPPTRRPTLYHGHPRPGRAGRPDGQGHYSARVLASKLRRHKSTCSVRFEMDPSKCLLTSGRSNCPVLCLRRRWQYCPVA